MTSPGQQKLTVHHYMEETVEHQNHHDNEQESLLKVREDLLNASEIRINT